MNRLLNQRVYLAGAMDRVPDRGNGWRDNITPVLEKLGVVVFNPVKKPTNVGQEDEQVQVLKKLYKDRHEYDDLSRLMKTIGSVDLRLVDISDFLLVNLDLETHPCGTLEEIFWANRQKKPIIIHMVQGKQNAPDWLFGTIPHDMIFSSWNEIQNYLIYINSSNAIIDHRRWYFFSV